ncbi:transaldolase family protein [Vibrio fluvialis]|uniref:transaldolase family protein n=1 Tax=Vibrio fluvialis TaxID=676 RepID=UPI00117E967B|nr:transaldolase family protein [Vibrio fluvialis]MBL4288243.1 hypothetical protein [Vibrio fluvialis]MBL4292559.1 hypothetical protein [Vibrio fluvialis]MBL4305240.1 hypothetical protein [Vibrio fluvialis]MBY7907492.1 hypothetical protein [Vibrio fluvialis]MBY8029042.1 hypothetical protein [Vibrio fluvialis]
MLSDLLPIAGVTTNPTIVAKSGLKMVNLLPQIREALDTLTGNAIETVESIAHLLSYHAQSCKIIGASFKNTKQVIECLSVRQSSVTIPVELAHK